MSDLTNPRHQPDSATGAPLASERAHLEEERRIAAAQQSDDPDRIRNEIRMTRSRMDSTLYELEDRVAPSRVAERSKQRLKTRWRSVRDNVMGSVDDLTPSGRDSATSSSSRGVGDVASDAADQARQAPQRVKEQARGNPLAAGMIAFGVGALASALLPGSDQEQQLVEDAADRVDLQQVRGEVEQVVDDIRQPVEERAREGVEQVRQTAQSEADGLKGDTQQAGQRVASHAQDAGDEVRRSAKDS